MTTMYFYNEVLPPTAMVIVECTNVVLNILFKAASLKGLSYYIFLLYSYALASLSLLPLIFFLIRKAGLPPFKFPLISRLCLLAIIGFLSQFCQYKGLELGTPTLSSAISNLIPAFTFILAVFFRMEKVALRSSSSQAKIIGTIASISGASAVVFYKGPKLLSSQHWASSSSELLQPPLASSQSNWVNGGILLAVGYLFASIWYIMQVSIMNIYPEEIIITFISNFSLTILYLPVCLVSGSDLSFGRLPSIATASILYAGLFGLSFSGAVHIWGVRLKGPVFVAIFRPLSIVIAAIMSAIFLGDALYLGSVIGALILSAGLYVVLWGKAKEEDMKYYYESGSGNSSPLWKKRKDEEEDEM